MGQQVVMNALMQCSFGVAPCSLIVIPSNKVMAVSMPAANIQDYKPVANIPSFSMCTTVSNPAVASATTAAMGVLTPMPCVPVTTAPWFVGCTSVMIGGQPALNNSSKCVCSYGGMISINYAGQATVQIP